MGECIQFEEREVKAKGLNKQALPNKEELKKYFFSEEWTNFNFLEQLPKQNIPEQALLFYPGAGADILSPLIYLQKFFHPVKEIDFLFVDINNDYGMIKTILDDVGISFTEKKNNILKFYWYGTLVNLAYLAVDVFSFVNKIDSINIYFERAFRIMREQDQKFEDKIFEKLKTGGVLISDSGFTKFPLKKIDIPLELSNYGEMIIGVKE